MEKKVFLLLSIIVLLAILVVLDCPKVWAEQEGPPQPFDDKKSMISVEFSNLPDKQAQYGAGGWGLDGTDPLQVIYTQPPDALGGPFPWNAFDYGETGEVDALANVQDLLFYELLSNEAHLLVSFQGDPSGISVWIENCWAGNNTGPIWSKTELVNDANGIYDLDGLEVWGPLGSPDANFYSLVGDPIAGGFPQKYSVFAYNRYTGESVPYVPHLHIVNAVQYLGYAGPADAVDLDALMVYDYDPQGAWSTGDVIIFSIRAAGNWDGGEIVVLYFYGPAPFFLNHGGHLWNTAFPVAATFHLDPPTEEVDAIESYPGPPHTPTLTYWGLFLLVALLITSSIFILSRRKKTAVLM
jgi:hypothetical protein